MSKGAIIIGGAIAALALFYKPITDMLNGIIGGGGGFGDYFNARDTSTSQGPAYDPPNPDAPLPPPPEPTPEPEPTPTPSGGDDSTSTTDTKGTDQVTTPDPSQQSIFEYLKTPEGALNAAFVGAIAAPPLYQAGKRIIPKALEKGKNIIPKVVEKSKALKTAAPKAAQTASRLLKTPAGRGGAVITASAITAAAIYTATPYDIKRSIYDSDIAKSVRGLFGVQTPTPAPQNKGGSAPSKYVNTQSINTQGIPSAPVISAQGGYSPTASWRSSGFSTSGGVTSYMGVKLSAGITPQNLSPKIAKAIQDSKKTPPPPPPKTGGKK